MAGVTQVRPELEGGTQRTLKELIGHIAGDLYIFLLLPYHTTTYIKSKTYNPLDI